MTTQHVKTNKDVKQ